MLFKKYIENVRNDLKEEGGYLTHDLQSVWTGKKNVVVCIWGVLSSVILLAIYAISFIFCVIRIGGYYRNNTKK
ncbi:MAG TPA: hypothetical protein P5323_02815 [Candidatus Moranbacteria bacterium]|nr:hypothetical protein [Candidatus Moranbacteria bacterium]HRY28045.1 hypothetical protein [Candidatus Moranbacteria bacterium]HSA07880.1 hypothetical protein [Candidatus Moranbacteria bacterium]